MSLNHPLPSENYAPAYQISAMPYLSSSVLSTGETRQVNFGYVSRFIQVKNTGPVGSVLAFGFTPNGMLPSRGNFFNLASGEMFYGEIRCTSLLLSASSGTPSFSLLGGLTMIPERFFTPITGSNGYPGVG